MASLHYQNLGVHRPDVLLMRARNGVREFETFLSLTKRHLNSDECVLRLAWRDGAPPDGTRLPRGAWVELLDPPDRRDVSDKTFDAFLDEDVREIFEADAAATGLDDRGRRARYTFARSEKIAVLGRDVDTGQLLLDRVPRGRFLLLKPNDWPVECQLRAVRQLRDAPAPEHLPLLRLFERSDMASWPGVTTATSDDERWRVLTKPERVGIEAQREFVRRAEATPDFALLEGPPGSGKTTAICEVILRLTAADKRVLLCASTHVAVDNVLERLAPWARAGGSDLVPVRVGDASNVSDRAKPFQLDEIRRTERARLLDFLGGQRVRSAAQERLFTALQRGPTVVERMILDAANVVCGTTIGILQHPDIKAARKGRQLGVPFDVLVIDEASKTTFQEFLVPALLAKRWIIVGDRHQLSPYVDDAAFAVNVAVALPNPVERDACLDVFRAAQGRPTVVVSDDGTAEAAYREQAAAQGVLVARASEREAGVADIVFGVRDDASDWIDALPLDIAVIRGDRADLDVLVRRIAAGPHGFDEEAHEATWESEIGWRITSHYEQRLAGGATQARLRKQIDALLPCRDPDAAWTALDRTRRVALPSVLESLQVGFERGPRQADPTALSDGLPKAVFDARHVLLEWQHRMVPAISVFSRTHIYDNRALHDAPETKTDRGWRFGGYASRAVWLDVRGRDGRHENSNTDEAAAVMRELGRFHRWAATAPRPDGEPWEVAILTFYRGQYRELRDRLRKQTKLWRAVRHFPLGDPRRPDATVELCTVDRFQGHEADIVFLSIAHRWSTPFLESPNRLNVALTRARHQRVIVGDRNAMRKSRGPVLRALALSEPAEHEIGDER